MDAQEIGTMIQRLREQQNLTQKTLAERLAVSDKTISKWETGRGLPDMALFQPLAEALQVSVSELFSGVQIVNQNRSENLKKMGFYVCPICGNVLYSMAKAFSAAAAFRCRSYRQSQRQTHIHAPFSRWNMTMWFPWNTRWKKHIFSPFLPMSPVTGFCSSSVIRNKIQWYASR